ncbi:MAG: N-acetylmuramoyl-L-alanine amidase [Bacilli bacterium]
MKRLVIDLEHGCTDPGTIGPNKIHEADVVLAIGKELSHELKSYKTNLCFATNIKKILKSHYNLN